MKVCVGVDSCSAAIRRYHIDMEKNTAPHPQSSLKVPDSLKPPSALLLVLLLAVTHTNEGLYNLFVCVYL